MPFLKYRHRQLYNSPSISSRPLARTTTLMPTADISHLAFTPSSFFTTVALIRLRDTAVALLAIAILRLPFFRVFEVSTLLITNSAFPPSLSRIGSRGRAEASTMLAARPPCSRVLFPLAFLLIPLVSSPPSSSPRVPRLLMQHLEPPFGIEGVNNDEVEED